MTTNNSSSVYVQRSEYNSVQSTQPEVGYVSITDTGYYLNRAFSYRVRAVSSTDLNQTNIYRVSIPPALTPL